MSLRSIRHFIKHDLATIFILFIWLSMNILLFIGQFMRYQHSPSFFYLRALLSDGLCTARAAALCLNFNCSLILLPVCRNLLSFIRYLLSCCMTKSCLRRVTIRLFDKHIGFHRCVGYAICFWSIIHVGAHFFNFQQLIAVHNEYSSLVNALNLLFLQSPQSQINPVTRINSNSSGVGIMLGTVAGVTGVILCVCLLVIFSSSTALIRRSFYEIFWFAHHFFVVFFICLMFHGTQGLIRSQINVQEHNPDICAPLYREWGVNQQCLIYPRFTGLKPTSWMWLCGPLALYILERILRFIRSLQHVEIVDVIRHQSNVIELRFQKKSMTTPQPGQYIYLKFSSLAKFEWHPFTVTSSAEDAYVSVHIRIAGDWTKDLANKLDRYPQGVPRLSVDGPYGSPADDVFNYDGVVLVGAGIGVTPYASILKHIRSAQSNQARLRRVYFYWICNTASCYEWFAEMLQELERHLRNRKHFFTSKIYLTRWSANEVRAIIDHDTDECDIWTGLQSKTHYGRPHFDLDFQSIINEDWTKKRRRDIGVFVCGPKPLVKQLQRLCITLNGSNASRDKVHFYLNKENF